MLTCPNSQSNIEKDETLSMCNDGIGFGSFGISIRYFLRYLKKF